MSWTTEQLYELLPGIYRARDAELGEPLKALIGVIAEQAGVMESDIAELYENWFVETCDEWVVPYIGDLLGVRGLHALGAGAPFSQRALVANALGYRRRKGTPTMLEQLARDTTGWDTRAVEFFQLLETTQHYNHIRPKNVRTPDLRDTNQLELVDSAFDTAAHTADVRSIAKARGWHNIPNVGFFIWRLQSYFVLRSQARPVASPADGRYTFNPLGHDAPLFNRPQTETAIAHLAEEINVPALLRRRPLYDELEARRQTLIDGGAPAPIYFGVKPVLQVFTQTNPGDQFSEALPEEILICNLTEPSPAVPEVWLRPPTSKLYQPSAGGAKQPRAIKVAVDPVRGRLAFPKGVTPNAVKVSYAYGFSGDVGGGPYDRRESISSALDRSIKFEVSKEAVPVPGKVFATLGEAVSAWNIQPKKTAGVIVITDSSTYEETLTVAKRIKVPEGSKLSIVAGDQRRPHILGDIAATGTAPATSETPGELALDGLLIEGSLTIEATFNGNLGSLTVAHCTLAPKKGGLSVNSKNDQLKIVLKRSICGPVTLPKSVPRIRIEESIIDGAGGDAISAPGTTVDIEKSTVLGASTTVETRSRQFNIHRCGERHTTPARLRAIQLRTGRIKNTPAFPLST